MGLDFDIRSAPPNPADIAAAYAKLAEEHQRLRELNKKFLIVTGSHGPPWESISNLNT